MNTATDAEQEWTRRRTNDNRNIDKYYKHTCDLYILGEYWDLRVWLGARMESLPSARKISDYYPIENAAADEESWRKNGREVEA